MRGKREKKGRGITVILGRKLFFGGGRGKGGRGGDEGGKGRGVRVGERGEEREG